MAGVQVPNIVFGAPTTLAYSENGADTGGTLTLTDGRHAAAVALLGNYMAGSFVTTADGHGGTLITEGSQMSNQQLLDAAARLIRQRPRPRSVQAAFTGLPVLREAPARDGKGSPRFFSARFN